MKCLFDIPDEVVEKVLDSLPFDDRLRVSTVCKRFHRLVFHSKVKHRFCVRLKQSDEELDENALKEMRDNNRRDYENALNVLSDSFTVVSDLLLDSIQMDFDNSLDLEYWKRLAISVQSLQLVDCLITDFHLFNILSELRPLSELNLNNNHYIIKCNKNCPKILPKVTQCLSELKVLDFSGNKSFKLCDALFVWLASECRSLQVLNLSKCKIVFHFQIIRRYYGTDCTDQWKSPTHYAFTFAVIKTFIDMFGSDLKRLDFSETDICFQHLIQILDSKQLIELKEINLKNCNHISAEDIEEIRKLNPNINFIYL